MKQGTSDASQRLNVVFLDRATLSPQTQLRALTFPHELTIHENSSADQIAQRVREADVIITNKVKLSAEALSHAKKLQLVAVAATGTDNVDIRECAARGIFVSNIRGYAVHTVPEHTFALIFALRRSLIAYRDAVRAGRWAESGMFCFFDYPIRDLSGSTLGIIGDGALGKAVAQIGQALGMRVLFSDYKGTSGMGPLYTPFESVLEQSDVLTLHCPLTPATRNLIGAEEFLKMKRRPLLINTARGGLVDEEALVEAIEQGTIAGAGFDVVTSEPLPHAHPFTRVLGHPNFILTPHVAWASDEAVQGLADQLIGNIEAWRSGTPRNLVTVE